MNRRTLDDKLDSFNLMRKRILDKKVFNEAKLYISPDSE
jgi:hypothetical protein